MGNCVVSEQYSQNHEIEKGLKKDRARLREEVKLLLLGPGESGKSTIFKQMKILQDGGGYSKDELQGYKYIIYTNCVSQMKVLAGVVIKYDILVEKEGNKSRIVKLATMSSNVDENWSLELGLDIKALWEDASIQKAYSMRNTHFQLNDSAIYFFENVERFLERNYVPSLHDVLRARVRSTGVNEAVFRFEEIPFRVVDVGGQRSERRKWMHCFECVDAVLFCVAISEYDQVLREDDKQPRMEESIMLFDEIVNCKWFRSTTFILFLNKIDLFKEKLETVELKTCFPNYAGGKSFDAASAFIKARFLEKNQYQHDIYPHFTCALSTENIDFVFRAAREILLKKIMNSVIL